MIRIVGARSFLFAMDGYGVGGKGGAAGWFGGKGGGPHSQGGQGYSKSQSGAGTSQKARSMEPWFCGLCNFNGVRNIISMGGLQWCWNCKLHKGRGDRPSYGMRVDYVLLDRDTRYDLAGAAAFMHSKGGGS